LWKQNTQNWTWRAPAGKEKEVYLLPVGIPNGSVLDIKKAAAGRFWISDTGIGILGLISLRLLST
jgi:hypothetical protein